MPYFVEIETGIRRPEPARNGWHRVNLVGRLD